jgi:formamidopyrimidine-DNA glycosylase
MPELPEVETIVRELRTSNLIGQKIVSATVLWAGTIAEPTESALFASQIAQQVIGDISRRGKFIVLTLTDYTLLVHLRMTGKFIFSTEGRAPTKHERVALHLEDGRWLHYEDQRKFGKWYLLSDPTTKLYTVGLEPLSSTFTLEAFENVLQGRKQLIKHFLLDQRYVAGIGNIYADEALWQASIHPMRKTSTLSKKEIAALHGAIVDVLLQGIAHMGTSLGNKQANYFSVSGRRGGNQTQLKVFRREGELCPRCGTELIKITVATRGTHLCPTCQQQFL